jgi:preprotein translocase subunit SecF
MDDPRIALGILLVTTLMSLIGFISKTWLAWRKERRDAVSYRLRVERQQLEIEQLRLELEKEKAKEMQNQPAPASEIKE